jgi:hypothetical protein
VVLLDDQHDVLDRTRRPGRGRSAAHGPGPAAGARWRLRTDLGARRGHVAMVLGTRVTRISTRFGQQRRLRSVSQTFRWLTSNLGWLIETGIGKVIMGRSVRCARLVSLTPWAACVGVVQFSSLALAWADLSF